MMSTSDRPKSSSDSVNAIEIGTIEECCKLHNLLFLMVCEKAIEMETIEECCKLHNLLFCMFV